MERYLFVIDYQVDFVDGALGFPGAEKLDRPIAEKVLSYGPGRVYFTRDTHFEDYLQTREGRNLPVIHCVKGTPGWELDPRVQQALRGAEIVDKPTFGSTVLAEKLARIAGKEPVEVTLVGLCTDICVVSNALLIKAFLPEVPVKVFASCCAGVTPESHQKALDTMRMCQVAVQADHGNG